MRKKGRKKRAKTQTLASHEIQQGQETEPAPCEGFVDYPEVDEPLHHVRRLSGGNVPHTHDD